MNFNLEFELEEFRVEQKELFDEENKRYTGVSISHRQAEKMLQLINMMEAEIRGQEKQICDFCEDSYRVQLHCVCERCRKILGD